MHWKHILRINPALTALLTMVLFAVMLIHILGYALGVTVTLHTHEWVRSVTYFDIR